MRKASERLMSRDRPGRCDDDGGAAGRRPSEPAAVVWMPRREDGAAAVGARTFACGELKAPTPRSTTAPGQVSGKEKARV